MKVKKITQEKYNNETPERKNYSGKTINVGIDVHGKFWVIAIVIDGIMVSKYSQNPDPSLLYRHLINNYPYGEYKCVYEAGFCGFWVLKELNKLGLNCIVVNPADVPSKHKERTNKNDRVDARKLARELYSRSLEAIHIPTDEAFGDRCLLRSRSQFVTKITRSKNQIKSLLNLYGINTPEDIGRHWSKRYIEYLKSLDFGNPQTRTTLKMYLMELEGLRAILTTINKEIRALSKTERYKKNVECLSSIYGVDTLSAMILLTEIEDISRFKCFDSLCKYVGLIPNENSSGEKENKGKITSRTNRRLRPLLLEISWTAVRYDLTLKELYEKYQRRMQKKKAIIKIARHILNRIRYVLKNQEVCKQLKPVAA